MPEQAIYGLAYVEHLSYIGFFLVVAFSGYIIPLPEEIVLLLAGYMAAEHVIRLPVIIIICVIAAVCGDSLIFYLAGHGSRFTKKYHSRVEKTHLGWYLRHMKNSPAKTIFFSRFIVGFRLLNPLVSGLLRVPADIFVLSTALSATLYVPFVIFLGYYFSHEIHRVLRAARSVREIIIIGIVLGSLVLLVLFIKNLWEKAGSKA